MSPTPLITIVDSDVPYLEMMSGLLNDEGYKSLTLHATHETFITIKTRQPQLVILEMLIINPEHAWMVLNKMRLDPETTHIPVIIASTASDLLARNEENLRAKHCDILLKPFDLEELLVMVGKYAPLS